MDHLSNFDRSSSYVLEAHEAMRTYKFMTSEKLGATYNPEERQTSCSGSNYCVFPRNCAPPMDNTMTIQTPFGKITTDSVTFWSEFFSTNDFVFKSEISQYLFIEIVGFGGTALTTKCRNQETGEMVAIKVGLDEDHIESKEEKKILNKIQVLGSDNYNIVKFYEDFNYKTKHCLVFENLDIDLAIFTETIIGSGLHLCDIRLIAQQVLVALDFLHSNGIVHRDIKPNNIMLVDRSSLKVKLIDMGFSKEIESMSGICVNPLPLMPPEEIMLDKPDASVDMWCLGLTLIYFYLKDLLFDYDTYEETLAAIVKMLGEPHCSENFSFWKNEIKRYDPVLKLQSLDDLLEIRPATQDPTEREDLLSFIDFLKQLLVTTPQERITSAAALKHNFITMDHLSNFDSSSSYVLEAHEAMRTYKFMTSEKLGATYNPEERQTSCSGSNYCVFPSNCAPPMDNTMTIQTPFGTITTDSVTFWSEFFSTKDFVFKSEISQYLFIEIVGFGGTALTTKCRNQETGEMVAIKVGLDEDHIESKEEKKILNKIQALGSDNYNIVKFYEDFNYKTKHCLVFENLDIDLAIFTETIIGSGLHLCDIRLIAQQVLVALDFLHSNGIVHRDIKPNNIMLVDRSSLKVKLIDMGFSKDIESMSGICVNPLPLMPPEEIMLDKPDASVDMWCLGLTLIYFYLKDLLFDYDTYEETLAAIVKMLGEPHCSENFSFWKNKIKKYDPVLKLQSLDDLLEIRPTTQDPTEREDLLSFIDFLKQLLVTTPQERITSAAALKHNFITMDHLSNFDSSSSEAHEARRTYRIKTSELCQTPLFHKRLPASVSLSEQKQASPPSSRCVVMDKQLNTEEKLSKKSEDTKPHVQDNTNLTNCKDPSHLVEVKTRKKFRNRVKTFFSNINCFGLCLATKN